MRAAEFPVKKHVTARPSGTKVPHSKAAFRPRPHLRTKADKHAAALQKRRHVAALHNGGFFLLAKRGKRDIISAEYERSNDG